MEMLVHSAFWIGLGKIIWVNLLLSGDNAVVIALAARSLPPQQQKMAVFWGAGAEGFLDVKNASGDPHKIIITLSNLFTTPLATAVPFNWRDLTPVQMLALDNFVLWVNAKTPYKTPKEFIEAAKKAGPGKMKMGGTGAKQEDQIITAAIEQKLSLIHI